MEILLIGLMVTLGLTNILVLRKASSPRALTASTPVKALEGPTVPPHSLTRTWIVSTQEGKIGAGWRWKCSCGVWGVSSDSHNRYNPKDQTTAYSLGTEKSAIAVFKEHARQYNEVNTDYYKEKFEKEQAEFAEYRKLCYCKDANDALLPWRNH
jgi:hypothetical protein